MSRIILTAWIAVFLPVAAGRASAETPEEKLVRELYGKRIEEAKATPADADDVALAKELLTAANDTNTSEKMKVLLAQTALNLLTPLGTEEGVALARKALDVIDRIQPMPPGDKAGVSRDLAARCLAHAAEEKLRPDQIKPIALDAAKAHLDYAQIVMQNPDELAKAEGASAYAARIVDAYRLTDLNERVSFLQKAIATMRVRHAAIQTAMARFKTAQAGGSELAIKAASRGVADVYLTHDGDLVSAHKYLASTGDPRESAVGAAATFLTSSKLDPATCLEAVQALANLCKGLGEEPRAKVADVALQMCKGYLTGKTTELGASKAKLLTVQLQTLLGMVGADELRRKIDTAYHVVNCKIEVLEGNRIRATYDFSDEKQMKDWDAQTGTWGVGKGALVCKTEAYSAGQASNKLRFRADKPYRIAFTGAAKYDLTASLYYGSLRSSIGSYYARFSFNSGIGLSLYGYGTSWYDYKTRLQGGTAYKFEIAGDGKGALSWSINGVLMKDVKARDGSPYVARAGDFSLCLGTDGSDRTPTAFKGVIVEGEIVLNPKAPSDE